MEYLNTIFNYYDQLIAPLSTTYQALISIMLLIFLIWNIYQLIKGGHWIFIAVLIVMLPGTWPAARMIGELVWAIISGLLMRI